MAFNKVILSGNLTRDIEIKNFGSTSVGNFTIAVNNKYKDKNGQMQEDVAFVDCAAWGRTAETMAQYLGKGRKVLIEGRIKQENWEKDGQKRSKLTVTVSGFEFMDSNGNGSVHGGDHNQPGKQQIDQSDIPF